MKMYRFIGISSKKIVLFFLIFIQILPLFCQVERSGDKRLKKQSLKKNYFIGVSESRTSFEDAMNKALEITQIMIAQELGISIHYLSTNKTEIIETERKIDTYAYIQKEIKLESEHTIRTRINALYYEKIKKKKFTVHKVWVELFFNSEVFFQQIKEFWITELLVIRNTQNIYSLQRLLDLKEKFESEKKYLPNEMILEYNDMYSFLLNYIKKDFIFTVTSPYNFSNNFTFTIYNNNTNRTIADFPIKINNEKFLTNSHGIINYTADYNEEIIIILGHNLDKYIDITEILIYKNDTFSPLFNKNIKINIYSDNLIIKNIFTKIFSDIGFRIDDVADILIHIKANCNSKRISIDEFLTELQYELMIDKMVYPIPFNRTEVIKGYGKSENEAILDALSMNWLNNKEAEFNNLVIFIKSLLLN